MIIYYHKYQSERLASKRITSIRYDLHSRGYEYHILFHPSLTVHSRPKANQNSLASMTAPGLNPSPTASSPASSPLNTQP